jgi:hypothetical protein
MGEVKKFVLGLKVNYIEISTFDRYKILYNMQKTNSQANLDFDNSPSQK